ncbi:hypothetical protein MAUB1S_06389 [Mycolicibacterium aubagnense]
MTTERRGGCACGKVRYSVSGDPLRVGLCHCTDCRRTSGSAFTFYGIWPLAAFKCEGQTSAYKDRSFCPTCGGQVFALSDTEAEIMAGTLDEAPSGLVPQYELWIPRREPWLHALPGTDQFQGNR